MLRPMQVLGIILLLCGVFSAIAARAVDEKPCYTSGQMIEGVPEANKNCCEGLRSRTKKENYDENCTALPVGGYAGICIPCGNGVCEEGMENKCNCPEDCDE